MTRAQLEDAVAEATGEPTRTVTGMGPSVVPDNPADHEPEPLYLVINCPHCHEVALCPGQLADGSYPMAECPGCDALFVFDIQDVSVAASVRG